MESGGDQEQARAHKHELEPHKDGLRPMSFLAASEWCGGVPTSQLQKLEPS